VKKGRREGGGEERGMIHYGTKTKEFFFQALKGVARVTRGGVGNLQQKGVEAAGAAIIQRREGASGNTGAGVQPT